MVFGRKRRPSEPQTTSTYQERMSEPYQDQLVLKRDTAFVGRPNISAPIVGNQPTQPRGPHRAGKRLESDDMEQLARWIRGEAAWEGAQREEQRPPTRSTPTASGSSKYRSSDHTLFEDSFLRTEQAAPNALFRGLSTGYRALAVSRPLRTTRRVSEREGMWLHRGSLKGWKKSEFKEWQLTRVDLEMQKHHGREGF